MSDNWHNEIHKEAGWFTVCKASISGKCLAVTHNEPFCHPECDKMDEDHEGEGDV